MISQKLLSIYKSVFMDQSQTNSGAGAIPLMDDDNGDCQI
jgi:hypothetical protein